jgi:hypothetical protein
MRVETDGIQISRGVFFWFSYAVCSPFRAGENGDVVFITLPPSQHTRTITVTIGQTRVEENASSTNNISSLHNVPSTQAPDTMGTSALVASAKIDVDGPAASSGDASAVDVSTINSALGTLDLGGPNTVSMTDLPSHLRERPLHDRFRVSRDVLRQHPPFDVGWKNRNWVVVIRR